MEHIKRGKFLLLLAAVLLAAFAWYFLSRVYGGNDMAGTFVQALGACL